MKKCPECNAENPKAANFCRRCRYEFPEATKDGSSLKPEIEYFRIKESQYVIGSTIHIEWEANNYTQIQLAGEDVTLYHDKELLVTKAIKLDLVVTNDYDQVIQSINIVPLSLPKIQKFTTSHYNVIRGKSVKLSWGVEGATKKLIRCDSEEIDISTRDEISLSPNKDTTYTLIAYSIDDKVTTEKSVSVKVVDEVKIRDFSSDRDQTIETMPVELRWDIENADKIMLYPPNIDVTKHNSIQLYPTRTTTYCLEASNPLSVKEKMITIGVKTLPRIDVKVSESLSRLEIPNCEIDLAQLSESIKETGIDRWMITPSEQAITKKIWGRSVFEKIKRVLSKNIQGF